LPAGSCNLRDLLKLHDKDDLAAARRAEVTLASTMAIGDPVLSGAADPVLIRREVSLPAPSTTASSLASTFAPAEAGPSPAPPIIPRHHTTNRSP